MPITRLPDADLAALPASLQIEPVGQCNLRCPMCAIRFRHAGPPYGPPAFMDRRLFEQIIDQFLPGTALHLQGLGEPLLHPGFFELVSSAVRKGMQVSTNSNMTLLDTQRAEECVQSGLSWVRISIDGAAPHTYQSIRIGSSLSRVCRNIELLQVAKERFGSATPHLYLVMVVMKRNFAELPDLVRLAHRYGLEHVFVQHLCHDFGEEELPDSYRSMRAFVQAEMLTTFDPREIARVFQEARTIARDLNIGIRLPKIDHRDASGRKQGRDRCDSPWRSLYISYDGNVMPCCTIGTPDRMTLGNANADPLVRIWNSKQYRMFRARLESADPPSICRSCSVYQGIF